jgi:uncharacterized protein YcaQ
MTLDPVYSLASLRAFALHAQGLSTPLGKEPSPTLDAIYDVIDRLGCLQLDTLQRVHRSHFLVVWSRLGRYTPSDLELLAYGGEERRLFEYWFHGVCYVPLSEYRYRLSMMRKSNQEGGWNTQWLMQEGIPDLIQAVLERVRAEGPLRVADFKHDGPKRGSWWDWKPAKRALEVLYNRGDLMIAGRTNFQRHYDMAARVLPGWVDLSEPSLEETSRFVLERAVKALGICSPAQVSDYSYDMKRGEARPYVEALVKEGIFVPIRARLSDQKEHDLIVHRDNLTLLEMAADGSLVADRTTFLSPFDSLFYPRGRDLLLWNFQQVLEAYKPAKDRKWGYFCLPILHRDRLIGRFDPKLDRKTGTLHIEALYLEPGIKLTQAMLTEVARAMRDFMSFHDAQDLLIEHSQPKSFGKRLLAAL